MPADAMAGLTALVTGASRGIGRSIAEYLARAGYSMTITARNEAGLRSAADELRHSGAPQVHVVAADAADRQATAAVVAAHSDVFGSMNVLIVNADVGTSSPVASTDLRRLDKTIEVNFVAPVVLIRQSLPLLRAAAAASGRGARIVALSSIAGAYAEPGLGVYGGSKAALLSLIDTVNLEESINGVTATAIAPAFVDTDMSAWAAGVVDPATMIPVADVVHVVAMALGLSPRTVVSRVVMARAGTNGHCA